MNPTKSILKSKTFWIQLIAIASSFYPPVSAWVASNPVAAVSALGAVNVLVRFVTKGQITIFPGDTPEDGSGGLGGPLRLILLMGTAAALVVLPSCATSVAPDGTKTTKPDADGLAFAQSIAALGVNLWQADREARHEEAMANAAAKARVIHAEK